MTDLADHVAAFRAEALRFCALVDEAGSADRASLFVRLPDALSRIYAAGARLPDVVPLTDELSGERLTREQWASVSERLRETLGDADTYWSGAPLDKDFRKPVPQSLADDLADIYRDLKDGLKLLDAGESTEAVWNWRFSFWHHWGKHAVDALRAIHERLAEVGGDADLAGSGVANHRERS